MKSFRNFLVKSTSECYFWLANKVSTDFNVYILKFSLKSFRISFIEKAKKVTFRRLLIQTLKYWKVFEIFWSKVHQNACYFWLANKVSTDSNEYFLKFSWKCFRISFRLKRPLLGHFWFKLTFKILKSFRNFLVKSTSECLLFLTWKQSFNWL